MGLLLVACSPRPLRPWLAAAVPGCGALRLRVPEVELLLLLLVVLRHMQALWLLLDACARGCEGRLPSGSSPPL